MIDGSPDTLGRRCCGRRSANWEHPIDAGRAVPQLRLVRRHPGRAGNVRDGDYFAVMAADLQEPPELLVAVRRAARDGRGRPGARGPPGPRPTRPPARPPPACSGGCTAGSCNPRCRRGVRRVRLQPDGAHRRSSSSRRRTRLSSACSCGSASGARRSTTSAGRGPTAGADGPWPRRCATCPTACSPSPTCPIRILLAAGVVGCVLVTVFAVVELVAWGLGLIDVAGYTPLILSVLFIGFLLTFSLGIVGSYVWRTYDNTKRRPLIDRAVRRPLRGGRSWLTRVRPPAGDLRIDPGRPGHADLGLRPRAARGRRRARTATSATACSSRTTSCSATG